jgi:hypothetical protein
MGGHADLAEKLPTLTKKRSAAPTPVPSTPPA